MGDGGNEAQRFPWCRWSFMGSPIADKQHCPQQGAEHPGQQDLTGVLVRDVS
jgi:hypothetical protein